MHSSYIKRESKRLLKTPKPSNHQLKQIPAQNTELSKGTGEAAGAYAIQLVNSRAEAGCYKLWFCLVRIFFQLQLNIYLKFSYLSGLDSLTHILLSPSGQQQSGSITQNFSTLIIGLLAGSLVIVQNYSKTLPVFRFILDRRKANIFRFWFGCFLCFVLCFACLFLYVFCLFVYQFSSFLVGQRQTIYIL